MQRQQGFGSDFDDDDDDEADGGAAAGAGGGPANPKAKIMGVDFGEEVPAPDTELFGVDRSDFDVPGALVCMLLSACESGSTGGDACRQGNVMAAAIDDVAAMNPKRTSVSCMFQHVAGITWAFMQHGLRAFVERGGSYVRARMCGRVCVGSGRASCSASRLGE